MNKTLKNKKKMALVLSGGGIKAAAFHIGVCLALQEKGFSFSGGYKSEDSPVKDASDKTIKLYVGSSAGAVISTILAAGHSVESLIHAFQVGAQLKRFADFSSPENMLKPLTYRHIFALNHSNLSRILPRFFMNRPIVAGGIEALLKHGFKINGFFSTKGIERYLRTHVLEKNDFKELLPELFIVGAQLNHSQKVIFGPFKETKTLNDILYIDYVSPSDAAAASSSLPPVFAPYGLKTPQGEDIYFFDGEIRDTLSTHVAVDHGADFVISSYSVQPYHFTPDMGSLHEYGIPMIINQALYQVIQQKIEKHCEHQNTLSQVYDIVNLFFKEKNYPEEARKNILSKISEKAQYRPEVDYIYIHPNPQNYEMFFVDHFSLNPEILEGIVKTGFKSAMSALRQYDL